MGRYPNDTIDRFWWRTEDAVEDIQATSALVDISGIPDLLPRAVMQNNHVGRNGSIVYRINTSTFSDGSTYYVLLCFVELDPRVNATGLRVFNLSINGVSLSYGLDIYQRVGLNTGYVIYAKISLVTKANGGLVEARSAPTSLYPPTIAGVEILQLLDNGASNPYSPTSSMDGTYSTTIVNVGHIYPCAHKCPLCWISPHTQHTWGRCKSRAYVHLVYISVLKSIIMWAFCIESHMLLNTLCQANSKCWTCASHVCLRARLSCGSLCLSMHLTISMGVIISHMHILYVHVCMSIIY